MEWPAAGALGVCVLASFLLSVVLRARGGHLDRNDPTVVWYRVRALLAFTIISFCLTLAWLCAFPETTRAAAAAMPGTGAVAGAGGEAAVWTALRMMRLFPEWDFAGAACGFGVVLVLFVGPVVDAAWAGAEAYAAGLEPGMSQTDASIDEDEALAPGRGAGELARRVLAELSDFDDAVLCPPPHDRRRQLVILRDLIAAPILEEVLFRACMGSVVLASGAPPSAALWLTPLAFAGAHIHLGATELREGRTAATVAAGTLVRTAYTFVFGLISAHLWFGTRSIAAPVAAHLLCNWLGLPPFGRVIRHVRAAAACDGSARSGAAVPRAAVVVGLYVAGIAGFFAALPALTEWAAAASRPGLVPRVTV